ncbi:hypothetical protein BLOT_003923 [Blomia tropicalis]|nr:hypothetical protein BLOT_003923 [Blomia tropicalis]
MTRSSIDSHRKPVPYKLKFDFEQSTFFIASNRPIETTESNLQIHYAQLSMNNDDYTNCLERSMFKSTSHH